jgi:hypothetical protein
MVSLSKINGWSWEIYLDEKYIGILQKPKGGGVITTLKGQVSEIVEVINSGILHTVA